MTVRLLTQSSHMKVSYKEATKEEIEASEKIILKVFRAEDSTLKRTIAVRRGLASAVRSFYIQDSDDPLLSKNFLPVGFLPWLTKFYNDEQIKYEHIEMRKWPKINKEFAKDLIDGKIICKGPEGIAYKPRDYQIRSSIIAAKSRTGIIQLPVGAGKGFILALLCKIYSEHDVLCLFNSIDLVNQTYKNFTYKYGIDPKEIGIIQGQNFQDDRRITIMSVASYEKAFHVFPRIKVILIDEVHELGSGSGPEQATKVLFACQNAPIRIGLSATADAIDNPFRQMALYGNVGPIIYEQTIQEKIEEGSLANIKVKMYNVNCQTIQCSGNWADSYEQTRISTKKFRQQCVNEGKEIFTIDGKEYIREMVARGDESNLFVFNEHRNNMIVEHALENKRVLILYTRREQGEILETKLKKILGENKVKRVDGMDDSKTREEAKEFLLENEDNVVLASAMWNTGVDIPWLHTLIIASGGRGTAMIIQRLGRSTRKHDDTNKEYATVIDYIDNFSKISHNQSNKRLSVYRDKLGFDVEII